MAFLNGSILLLALLITFASNSVVVGSEVRCATPEMDPWQAAQDNSETQNFWYYMGSHRVGPANPAWSEWWPVNYGSFTKRSVSRTLQHRSLSEQSTDFSTVNELIDLEKRQSRKRLVGGARRTRGGRRVSARSSRRTRAPKPSPSPSPEPEETTEAFDTEDPPPENGDIEIKVHWNIITDEDHDGSDLSDDTINQQMDVLNEDYIKTPFKFVRGDIERIENPNWFHNVTSKSDEEVEMKEELHKGEYSDLNVYTVGFTGTQFLGYGSFPQHEPNLKMDGLVLRYNTLPGAGGSGPFIEGRTATHEIGHWLGLHHTFRGGCNPEGLNQDGDFVDDTPVQGSASFGCPLEKKSCDHEEPDDVRNFMDYTDDSCMEHFTSGQIARTYAQWMLYRN